MGDVDGPAVVDEGSVDLVVSVLAAVTAADVAAAYDEDDDESEYELGLEFGSWLGLEESEE